MSTHDRDRKIIQTLLREMRAYGAAWRADWSDFDGRTLRDQLGGLATWAERCLDEDTFTDCVEGTEFEREHQEAW